MVKIVTSKKTTIQEVEGRLVKEKRRPYLGMSMLGHSCPRYLWMYFRWVYPPKQLTPRQIRLLSRGDREEEIIVNELINTGYEIWDVLSDQVECVSGFGHIKGHPDGKGLGFPEAPKTVHLLEFKTMNKKNFSDLLKKGVEVSKPIYYAQCQLYMYFEKLERTMFIAVQKDDDQWKTERIKNDKNTAQFCLNRGESVILSANAPKKMFKQTWYECKFCDAAQQCHYGKPLDKNCRTCVQSEPDNNGKWFCNFLERTISIEEQEKGCESYHPLTLDK